MIVPTRFIGSWDVYWIGMAEYVSQKSKDDSTKVGCVLTTPANDQVSVGYNGFPRGVQEVVKGYRPTLFESGMTYPPGTQFEYADGRKIALVPEVQLIAERWHERPTKYDFVEHAERNAVYNAARLGRSTLGSIAYLNFDPKGICSDCARALIQAGVSKVLGPDRPFTGAGAGVHYSVGTVSAVMFEEAGVDVEVVTGALDEY